MMEEVKGRGACEMGSAAINTSGGEAEEKQQAGDRKEAVIYGRTHFATNFLYVSLKHFLLCQLVGVRRY